MNIQQELQRRGAILEDGHFVYTSGRHGSAYVDFDPLFPEVDLMSEICRELADPFKGDQIEVVAGPAIGGVALAILTAQQLSGPLQAVKAVWAEKKSGFVFSRGGFVSHLHGRRVLVVEDLLNTGASAAQVAQAAKLHKAEVIGVSAICNRGKMTADLLGVPRLETLINYPLEKFEATDCPLCHQGVPIVTNIGHGEKFQLQKPDYPGGFVELSQATRS